MTQRGHLELDGHLTDCSIARAPPTFPQPTNATGLRRHSTNVQSIAFFSTAGYPWLYSRSAA